VTALVAASAIGARSISLLESVVIELILLSVALAGSQMLICPFVPSQPPHFLDEGLQMALKFRFGRSAVHEDANPPHTRGLLRPRRKRPRRHVPQGA
jgi:hypothetical protein